jgi:hypothetical protein
LRKKVDRWLHDDDPAIASKFQLDSSERDESRLEVDNVSQEISSVELLQCSSAEVSDLLHAKGLSASFESSLCFAAEYASDCPPESSSDEDIQQDTGSSEETGSSLQSDLAQWVVCSQSTRESCNWLLGLLRKHGCQLPKDKRTLVKTPRSVSVGERCGGQYVYFGQQKALHTVACGEPASSGNLKVQINVDGIPLYKSSSTQFWPILCTVNHSQPLIVALYLGKHKPNSVDDFLADFVQEASDLNTNGFTCLTCEVSKIIPFVLHSVYAMLLLGPL